MEYYLVRLSYTPAAWQDILDQTINLDQRLAPVRRLIKHLGGSLAEFHFFHPPHYDHPARSRFAVTDKFVSMGEQDLMTILAVPDKAAALAFDMAVSAEPGVKSIELVSIMPMEDAVAAMPLAKAAVQATGYSAPGRAKP
jgi:uncharacterized protein with GYD domain